METNPRPGDNSREPRPAKIDRRSFSAIATQNLSLRDRFELDRPCSSHGDNHHRVRYHVSNLPPIAYGSHSKQQTRRVNTTDNDELIKHMSNLPSYLERGKKPQEKAFNVGVLDWNLLEKWQSSKKVPYRRDGSSSSNSNSPSLFSAEESSTHSHTDQSSSAAHHEHQHHVYQFDLKGFPSEASTSNGKSSCNVSRNQRPSTSESILKEGSGSKGHCNSNLESEQRRSRRSQSMSLNHKFTDRDEKTVLIRPHNGCPIISASVGSNGAAGCKIAEKKERNCTERSRKAQYSKPSGDILQPCPLPCDANDQKSRVLKPCRSQDSKTYDSTSAAESQQHAVRKLISSSKEGGSKDKPAVLLSALPTVTNLPQGSRKSKPTVVVAEPGYPSPYDRFSFPIRTSSKKSWSTEDAQVLQACAAQAMPTPYIKIDVPAIGKPSCNISAAAAASKARSSPLKRLLEPLLKPREGNNNRSSASLKKDSKPVGRASEELDRPSTAPGTRVGLNQDSEKSTSILKPHQNGKDAESAVIQALLQVVVQNGCPFFTFAVENIKNILCAALSRLSTDKTYGDRYLYTFFSIHELKNRTWMNLRGRGNQEYSPNVVAQMEVSETRISNMADHPSTGNNLSRQFVLYNVDIKHGEKSELGYQLNDELAAVVVRIPGETDDKAETGKYNGTTVILPSGIHTVPCKGRPSSLIQRWKSGGQCDCGGWDAGCKLMILTDSKCQSSSSTKFNLYNQGAAEGKQTVFNLAPFKDREGVLSVSFSSSISPLQAFSICLATLDAKKSSRPPSPAKAHEAKSVHEICHGEVPGGYFSVPPHSPMGRA